MLTAEQVQKTLADNSEQVGNMAAAIQIDGGEKVPITKIEIDSVTIRDGHSIPIVLISGLSREGRAQIRKAAEQLADSEGNGDDWQDETDAE